MRAKTNPSQTTDGGRAAVAKGKPAQKRHAPLRPPVISAAEGIADLDEDEEAFIQEEIAERVERGWSQVELAKQAGISRGMVKHLEHRRRGPSLRIALHITRAFGSGVDAFIQAGRLRPPVVPWFLLHFGLGA
jgi:DNA-binding XRE family transcriptional regulator